MNLLTIIVIVGACCLNSLLFNSVKRQLIIAAMSQQKPSSAVLFMPLYVPVIEPLFFTGVVGVSVAFFLEDTWLRFVPYGTAFVLSTMVSIRPILEAEPASDRKRRRDPSGAPLPLHAADPNKLLFSESAGNVSVALAWVSFVVGALIFWFWL